MLAQRTLITLPRFKERSTVEIRFDCGVIQVAPSSFLKTERPAFNFVRKKDGVILATVPYQDRDAIFSHDETVGFVLYTAWDGASVSEIPSDAFWKMSPLQIKFCEPILCI